MWVMRRKLGVAATAAVLAFAVGYLFSPIGGETRPVVAVDDASPEQLARSLQASGAVRTRLGAAAVALAGSLGTLDPETGKLVISLGEASVTLPVEDQARRFVTVAEGQRREEMANVFAKELGWTDGEHRDFAGATSTCAFRGGEGYRFPGRYLVAAGTTPDEVVDAMEDRFGEVYGELVAASGTPALDPGTVVRVASMIQREAAGKGDMRLISGVIWNRMLLGMPLQVDATLQYAKGKEGRWWPRLTPRDKRIDSPFNTYQQSGLPPEPISSPGEAAIAAAMHPADTTCLFYIHDRSRTIHCSSDYAGHLRNISRYL